MKFSTWTIAAFGSTIRKYATAFTRAGTLSFVITSCGGMLSVIVRRSTRTIRSMIGISRNRPGPFGGSTRRPRRNTTPRSYSRATLTAAMKKSTKLKTMIARAISAAATGRSLYPMHDQPKPLDAVDFDSLAGLERPSVLGSRLPQLTAHEDEILAPGDAVLADHRRHRRWPPSRLDRLPECKRHEAADHSNDGEDEPDVDPVRCRGVVEERDHSDGQRD